MQIIQHQYPPHDSWWINNPGNFVRLDDRGEVIPMCERYDGHYAGDPPPPVRPSDLTTIPATDADQRPCLHESCPH